MKTLSLPQTLTIAGGTWPNHQAAQQTFNYAWDIVSLPTISLSHLMAVGIIGFSGATAGLKGRDSLFTIVGGMGMQIYNAYSAKSPVANTPSIIIINNGDDCPGCKI